ncbi:MAG: hypothetical protein J4G12_05555 [Gemmatimonadetes bacterium]|nr:hypothetical protein [Gemmatimonadota bacterium]
MSPPPSAAVTVIVAVPFARPSTVSVESVTPTVATLESDDDTEYVSMSQSGSMKLSGVGLDETVTVKV